MREDATSVKSSTSNARRSKKSGTARHSNNEIDSNNQNEQQSKPKRRKPFKRLRGLLTGESRKERKARKAAKRRARAMAGVDGEASTSRAASTDDVSTVYGVDIQSIATRTVDDRAYNSRNAGPGAHGTPNSRSAGVPTLGTPGAASAKGGSGGPDALYNALQVILLLMDPDTRRFELLQLEFDSNKAVVADVLAQVPHSVTEEALRKKSYYAISDRDGTKLQGKRRLKELCRSGGAEIFVGIPDGIDETECARLARPILGDDKVRYMLESIGIDVTGLKEAARSPPASSRANPQDPVSPDSTSRQQGRGIQTPAKTGASTTGNTTPAKKSSMSRLFAPFVIMGLLAIGLQLLHMFLVAPMEPGQTLMPGLWKVKCGMLSLLPSCQNAALEMNFQGELTYYGPGRTKEWVMQGGVCPSDGAAGCVRGLKVQPDGSVEIGGKKIETVTTFGKEGPELSPWPFEEAPKVSVVRKDRDESTTTTKTE